MGDGGASGTAAAAGAQHKADADGFAGDLGYHGDVAARGALVDFAVNVRGTTPRWLLDGLGGHLNELSAYPDPMLDRRVRKLIAARHGRPADEAGHVFAEELPPAPSEAHPPRASASTRIAVRMSTRGVRM